MPTPNTLISLGDTVQWSGKQLASEIDGEVVLMNLERGHYYSLDNIGSDIWNTIEQPTNVNALCDTLAKKYSGNPATITADVLVLLNQMLEQQLITVLQ
jgi:hypothetical protein